MKKTFLFKSMLLLVSFSCILFTSCGEDEPKTDDTPINLNVADAYENNNSFDSAEVVTIGNSYSCNLKLDDVDYFKVQDLSTSNVWDNYEVKFTSGSTILNPTFTSYDVSKNEVPSESLTNYGAGTSFTKTIMMRSGTFDARYFKISSIFTSATEALGYSIKVTKKNDNESTEPNNLYTDVSAKAYTSAQTIAGKCMTSSTSSFPDFDFIKITIPAGNPVKVLTYKVTSSNNSSITYDVHRTTSSSTLPAATSSNQFASATNASPINGDLSLPTYVYLKVKSSVTEGDYNVTIVSIQ